MNLPSPLQHLPHPTHKLWIKRDDLIHPIICGNKRRKISGYLQTHFPLIAPTNHNSNEVEKSGAIQRQQNTTASSGELQDYDSILTFGGAYSNHLRTIAHVGKIYHIPTIGIVRGEELGTRPLNDNLQFCHNQGMQLHFVDRETYRQIKHATTRYEIHDHISLSLQKKARNILVVPEGGCGPEGIVGTHEIIREMTAECDGSQKVYFCIEAGTGTTAAGCIQTITQLGQDRNIVVIPVLHDLPTITRNIEKHNPHTANYDIIPGYEHGGYAKTSPQLIDFIEYRKDTHHIHIEHTYSGKLFYAVYDLIAQGYFPSDAKIIIYHSGY